MFDKFFDALGDSLFFMIDRARRLRPGKGGSKAEGESLSDRAKSIDWSVLTDRAKFKAAINQHQLAVSVVIAVAFAAILIPMAVSLFRNEPQKYEPKAWYYDLGTGRKFAGGLDLAPPIAAPSGATDADGSPGGVRAHVMACGACGGADEQIVYLERMNPEMKAKLDAAVGNSGRPINTLSPAARREFGITSEDTGQEIAEVSQKPEWVPADSPEAEAILAKAHGRCPEGVKSVICLPE